MFSDFDRLKQEEIERKKRQRLEEVREQSKQIAALVRKKFQTEKQRQLQKVEESKTRELNCLRRQHAQKLRAGYESCLFQVGDAHVAAARENDFAKKLKQQKVRNDILAKRRGREAMQRAKQMRKASPKKNVQHPRSKSVSIQVDRLEKNVSQSSSKSLPPLSKPITRKQQIYAQVGVDNPIELSSSDNEEDNQKKPQMTESHMEYLNISSESLSSSLELIARDSRLSKVLPLAYDKSSPSENGKTKSTIKEEYNPDHFEANDTSENSVSNEGELPFTQVSDFLNKRRMAQENATVHSEPRVTKTVSSEPNIESTSKPQISEEIEEDNIKTIQKPISPAKKIIYENQSRSPTKKIKPQFTGAKKKIIKPTYVPMFYRPSSGISTKPSKPSIKDDAEKVQYYDHANRYSKEYAPNVDIIQKISSNPNERNAAEAAREEIQLDELRLERAKELQRKSELRSQQCLEKEKVRKDYEKLNRELDDLLKQENYIKQLTNINNFADRRSHPSNEDRQKEMNQKIEEIIHRPVIITCPRINAGINDPDNSGSSAEINMAAFQNEFLSKQQPTTSKTLNSSDSCSSILLGYVDGRTHELNKVIDSRGDNDVKREDLLKLVDKLNKQKAILLSQIENSADTVPTSNLENILKQLRNIDMEKENILINENDVNKENLCTKQQKELEEREKILKQKEQTLERQIKKLFLKEEAAKSKRKENKANQTMQKIKNVEIQTEAANRNCDIDILERSNNSTLVSNESSCSSVGQRAPVKIIINVNGGKKEKHRKSPTLSTSRQTSAKINDAAGQVFPKTPAKQPLEIGEKEKETVKTKQIQINIPPTDGGESISTVYRSPPQTIRTDFTKFIENKSKIQRQKLAETKSKKSTPPNIENPMLKHYITRLLGMSRASIEQLGVSSSTSIETPSTSIVNVSQNITSSNDASSIPEDRMEKLQKFIADNHSFLSEIEKSLKNQDFDETSEKDIEIVEQIWMKTLKEKERKMKKEKNKQKPKEKELKPILRKTEKSAMQRIDVPDFQLNDNNQMHDDLSKKYADLAASCSKRFAHLNEMIQKVRQEKQKLLETTFSSASDPDQQTTEFLEFAGPKTKRNFTESNECSQATTTEGKSLSYKDDLQFGDLASNKLIHSKQMGMSRDSGICTSRPVTSSDVRDSPDIRFLQKEMTPAIPADNEKNRKEMDKFEPLLKNIQKYDYRLDQQQQLVSPNDLNKCDTTSKSKDENGKKSSKPPTTLTRYSPQFDQPDIPHELSTIIEVDTPATSRLNASIPDTNEQIVTVPIPSASIAEYRKFPTVHEFLKMNNLDFTRNVDLEQTAKLEKEFQKIVELSGNSFELKFKRFEMTQEFVDDTEELSKIVLEITDPPDLMVKSYKNDKEIEDLHSHSSTSSLPDVQAELKKRNLLPRPFEFYKPEVMAGKSEKAEQPQKSQGLSDSDTLEEELKKIGIKWAGTMIRKTKQANALNSTTTSSSAGSSLINDPQNADSNPTNSFVDPNLKNEAEQSKSSDTSSEMNNTKPISLREFFMRELLKKSQSSSTSSSLNESSTLTNQLLKSLLAASTTTTTTTPPSRTPDFMTQSTPQRTSTPVKPFSSSNVPTTNFFSGDSISSVRNSTASSKNTTNTTGRKNQIYDELSIPNVKLNLPSTTTPTTNSSSTT